MSFVSLYCLLFVTGSITKGMSCNIFSGLWSGAGAHLQDLGDPARSPTVTSIVPRASQVVLVVKSHLPVQET